MESREQKHYVIVSSLAAIITHSMISAVEERVVSLDCCIGPFDKAAVEVIKVLNKMNSWKWGKKHEQNTQ